MIKAHVALASLDLLFRLGLREAVRSSPRVQAIYEKFLESGGGFSRTGEAAAAAPQTVRRPAAAAAEDLGAAAPAAAPRAAGETQETSGGAAKEGLSLSRLQVAARRKRGKAGKGTRSASDAKATRAAAGRGRAGVLPKDRGSQQPRKQGDQKETKLTSTPRMRAKFFYDAVYRETEKLSTKIYGRAFWHIDSALLGLHPGEEDSFVKQTIIPYIVHMWPQKLQRKLLKFSIQRAVARLGRLQENSLADVFSEVMAKMHTDEVMSLPFNEETIREEYVRVLYDWTLRVFVETVVHKSFQHLLRVRIREHIKKPSEISEGLWACNALKDEWVFREELARARNAYVRAAARFQYGWEVDVLDSNLHQMMREELLFACSYGEPWTRTPSPLHEDLRSGRLFLAHAQALQQQQQHPAAASAAAALPQFAGACSNLLSVTST